MKLKRTVSLMLVLALSSSMSATNVFAATSPTAESAAQTEESIETPDNQIYDTENEELVGVLPDDKSQTETFTGTQTMVAAEQIDGVLTFDANPKVIVDLPEAGDTKTFEIQIDHSLYPEAILSAFSYKGLGECSVIIPDVKSTTLRAKAISSSSGYTTKEVFNINGSGGIKNYTVTVSTTTGDASCVLTLATEDTLAQMCGGRENAISIQKNEASRYGTTRTTSLQSLLNGNGDWFRYTADGDTFIHASATKVKDFIITVYDADTETFFAETSDKDLETQTYSSTLWDGHVQKNFKLEPGHEYLIRVKSSTKLAANSNNRYSFSVGLPYLANMTANVSSTKTFSIPANTSKTFTFNVSGFPNSARLSESAIISFKTNSSVNNLDITSLRITAPNGKVLTAANYGEYRHQQNLNFNNYLTSLDNISLNGTWTVTVKAKSSLSGLKFQIISNAYYIPGSDGNE